MRSPFASFLRPLPPALVLAAALVVGAPATAQVPATSADTASIESMAREWATTHIAGDDDDKATLRPEVEVGELDSRLRLAPCHQIEPYLPRGAKLWGRTRIGVRCVDGPSQWNVFLPLTVKAWGPAWVARHPVAAGDTLAEDDMELSEVDWAEHPAPVLVREEDWVGMVAARSLMPGTVLRRTMIKPVQVFKAGTQVKVVVRQGNMRLSATGNAVSHGYLGQNVRVRMPNGRVLSGRALSDNTVELPL